MAYPLKCRECHRRLKQPTPTGYGPVCERRINGRHKTPTIPAPSAVEIHPGQTALDLQPMQPTLWSL
ncbi:hypothetical protein ACWC4D_33415 [Streptomyces sp. NPDC001288]